MQTSEVAKILGVRLYQEFSVSNHDGVLRLTDTMLELKVGRKWGPTYIQDLLMKAIVSEYQQGKVAITKYG